jgi:hypothetical protein
MRKKQPHAQKNRCHQLRKNHRARRGHRDKKQRSVLSVISVVDNPSRAIHLLKYNYKNPAHDMILTQPLCATAFHRKVRKENDSNELKTKSKPTRAA